MVGVEAHERVEAEVAQRTTRTPGVKLLGEAGH